MTSRPRWLYNLLHSSGSRSRYLPLTLFGLSLAILLTTILVWRSAANQDLEVGRPSPRTINAEVDLTYVSDLLTEAKRREVFNDPRNLVYNDNTQIHEQQREELQKTFQIITSIRNNPSLSPAQQEQQLLDLPTLALSETLAMQLVDLDDASWERIKNQTNSLYDRTLRDHSYIITETILDEIKTQYLPYNLAPNMTATERDMVLFFVEHTLHVNRTLNQEATTQRQEEASRAVQPVSNTIARGENIVRQGEIITREHFETLVKLGMITPSLTFTGYMARILLAIMITLGMIATIIHYTPFLIQRSRSLLVILILFILAVLVARLFMGTWLAFPELFALAVIVLPIVTLYGRTLGLMVGTLAVFVIMFIGNDAFQLGSLSFAGVVAAVFAIRRADRTMAFFLAGLWISATVFVTAMIWRLIQPSGINWQQVAYTALFSLINGSFSAMMALASHNVLGRVVGIITPMQLLELAHPNQPLLRRLMQEAPGTYHHSIVVSNIAEQAAERIGADPLLTRVGAYYHDIGKMLRPYFFTDNQHDRSNVHDNLEPQTSAKIIADHVIEGAKMARRQQVPEQIVAFIEQHHGTDVIRYFYQQALQSQDDVDINDFRYPGPKPQSKETAILMLADGVEATVRSREQAGLLVMERDADDNALSLPRGAQTIAQVVNQSIDSRISSGQLDQSPLTLRDLQTIRESFVKSLQGIYHPRVEYPRLAEQMQVK